MQTRAGTPKRTSTNDGNTPAGVMYALMHRSTRCLRQLSSTRNTLEQSTLCEGTGTDTCIVNRDSLARTCHVQWLRALPYRSMPWQP